MEQYSCAVDVISVCSTDGNIRPLRLRVEDASQEMVRIDIDEVVSVKTIPYVGVEAFIFICRAKVHDISRLFGLKYSIRSHTWSLLDRLS